MKTIKLEGKFHRIDKFNRGKFSFKHDQDYQKLVRVIDDTCECMEKLRILDINDYVLPFDKDSFKVIIKPGLAKSRQTIECIGLYCEIFITVKPYEFKSKLESNIGDNIKGVKLELVSIEPTI